MGKARDWVANKAEETFAKFLAFKLVSVVTGVNVPFPFSSFLWLLAGERAKLNEKMRDEMRRIGQDPREHFELFMPRR
ncbi:hypothetical protein [Sorangium sp. So ce128]|uniref:hypothetical protein n=1 Tax=Sorangium sp. So ce128 TaxID=3133281 RepID=UPI003F5FDC04